MAIVSIPADAGVDTIICIICQAAIPLAQASAGLITIDNQQAFACNNHFRSGQQFIVGWADFIIAQRTVHLHRGDCVDIEGQGGINLGWAVC